jgi:hypothetical protein
LVASSLDDLSIDDEDATPTAQEKPKQPKDDDQLRKAVELLKTRS